ncbi:MAG: hypothetical protein ACI84D_002501 [Thalassolituus oleivorans]|jgi:hypothetical protein
MTVFDIIGLVGVGLIVVAYILLQSGRTSVANPWFSVVNAVGSSMVLVSLYFEFNLAAAVVEVFWFVVSLYGLWRSTSRRSTASADKSS